MFSSALEIDQLCSNVSLEIFFGYKEKKRFFYSMFIMLKVLEVSSKYVRMLSVLLQEF